MAVRGRICLREIALVAPACFAIIDRFCGAHDWFLSRSRRNPSQKGAVLVGPLATAIKVVWACGPNEQYWICFVVCHLADVNADRSRADRTSYQREINPASCLWHQYSCPSPLGFTDERTITDAP